MQDTSDGELMATTATESETPEPEAERLLAAIRAQVQQRQAELAAVMSQVVILPINCNAVSLEMNDGSPGLLLTIQTPVSTMRLGLSRDQALALASLLRKQAQTGPALVTPPSGLVIPGR